MVSATLQARGAAAARHERRLFPVACNGLILIQASSAVMCSGKVAVPKNSPLKEEACDEILHPAT